MDSTPAESAESPEREHKDGDEDITMVQPNSYTRDATYYKEEGDCVILIDTTLFKINRFVLARDGSTFEGMFTLPKNNEPVQGSSDDNPIVLYDDTNDFRALCWALYALPMDISAPQLATESDVLKFLGIARLANKYHFTSFEKWSTSALSQKCMAEAAAFLLSCSYDILAQILDLAVLCRLNRLTSATANACLRQTKSGNLSIDKALRLGEKHGLRDLQGRLYYYHLDVMDVANVTQAPTGTAYIYDNSALNSAQMLRLYRGYWSLSKYWQNICKMPVPPFPAATGCNDTHHFKHCTPEWHRMWKNAISLIHEKRAVGVNVLVHLDSLKSFLSRPPGPYRSPTQALMTSTCAAATGGIVTTLRQELERTLAGHFLGPENP